MNEPVYATREEVMRALDSKLTARNAAQIDRILRSASRDVDHLCHRRFYPQVDTRSFDWPPRTGATPWILRLGDNELISVTTLTSGGTTIAADDYLLRRADDKTEPPYTRIEINLSGSASFGGGDTYQQNITITGLYGYRNDETLVGGLSAALASTTATAVPVTGAASAAVGVGSVLRIDDERLLVTGRTMADTGQDVGGAGLAAQANSVTLAVTDGTAFAVDEILLVDSERMLIVDIAGNTLTVKRAWDGSVLAAHDAGASVYAPRTLTVQRAALGTTAATHLDDAALYRWDPPGLVHDLTIAETIGRLTSETSAYTRALRSGDGSAERNRDQGVLQTLRNSAYDAVGRKARVRSV